MYAFLTNLITITTTLVIIFFAYAKWAFGYWQRRNIPYVEPEIPFGNVGDAIRGKENLGITVKKIYDKIKQNGWKHAGFYILFSPNYLIVDLDYVKNIMTRDFNYFTDRATYCNEKKEPVSGYLFNLGGSKWMSLRSKLTPAFTSGKMKLNFQSLIDCQASLLKRFDQEPHQAMDVQEIFTCFAIDVIGACSFGLECKALQKENTEFKKNIRKALPTTTYQRIKLTFCSNFSRLALWLNIGVLPEEVSNFFLDTVKNIMTFREKNNCIRNDFMQLLIDLKNNDTLEENGSRRTLTVDEVAAQTATMFLAGFETTSALLTFALYQLAKNPDIQDKVREEIDSVLAEYNGKFTYDSIQEMKYLGQVIDETLRMYPPVPFINRKCGKPYQVPCEDATIEVGTVLIIPTIGFHYDPELYPDPEKFDPERFTEENKKLRHNYAYLPFGNGPRNCIGYRFGLLKAKAGLSCLIRNFKFSVNKKTLEPLQIDPGCLVLAPTGKVWLDAEKVK